jgi:translation elongation factor EF-Tu-like GTPase
MGLCIERILPPCRERTVKFLLPPIESVGDISATMQAVNAALAKGDITPGEAATIAGVVESFARAIEITKRRAFAVDPLQVLALGDCDETEGYDEADGV